MALFRRQRQVAQRNAAKRRIRQEARHAGRTGAKEGAERS